MKSACFALFAAPLVLLAGCGERKPADPLAGLSEAEQRAAKAQAANICTLATKDGVASLPDAEMLVRMGDIAVGMRKGDGVKIVEAGNAIARARGCVPPTATQPVPSAAPVAPPKPKGPNSHVADNLNAADGMFDADMDGCTSVGLAILAANNPDTYGPTPTDQRSELKRYADRCGLRFQP